MKTLKNILVLSLIAVFGASAILCCCVTKNAHAAAKVPSCHKQTQSKTPVKSDQPCCNKMLKAVSDVRISFESFNVELTKSIQYVVTMVSSFTLTSLKSHDYGFAQISPQSPSISPLAKSSILRL